MASATLTSKGQITIPIAIRQRLGLRTGDQVDFIPQPDGTVRLLSKLKSFESLQGILKRPGQKTVTVEEMDRGIEEHIRQKMARLKRQRR